MCSPISHRNLARMKFAPFGNGSISLLNANWRREIFRAIDVADHPGIAHRDLDERTLVGSQHMPGALVAGEGNEVLIKSTSDAHRMPAPRAEVRRREPRALLERLAHGGDGARAHERHVGERHHIGVGLARGTRRAGEARGHAFMRVRAPHGFATFRPEAAPLGVGSDDADHARQLGLEVARGLDCDRNAMGQRVAQLVRAETRSGACCEQQADDVQACCFTSQAEGSKRGFGFAAQEGSETPWRTAVISARIATAISGGVFEPMYRPTGPRRRAISSAETSNSLSRSRRASLFFFEPIAPTSNAA